MTEEVKRVWERARAAAARGEEIRKKAADEKRDLTAEEVKSTTAAFTEYHTLKEQAEAHHNADQVKAEVERAVEYPLFGERKDEPPSKRESKIAPGFCSEQKALHAFITGGLGSVPADLRAGLVSEGKAFGETSNEAGGYLVSEEMANFIISKRMVTNKLRARCTVIPTRAASFGIPTFVDESNPAAVAEGGTVSETSVIDAFGKLLLTPAKHSLLWKITEELLEDAPTVESFLQSHFVKRCSIYEQDKILNGIGGPAQPFGLLQGTWTQTHDISGAADAIVPEDFMDAITDLTEGYEDGAVFLVPKLTLKALWKFRSMEGGEGTGQFLWLLRPSLELGAPDTVLGKPVIYVSAFADPSSDGDPMFLYGDLSTYYIADRIGITIQRLMELYSAAGHVGFRLRWRWDGSPSDENAFVRYNRN